MCWSLENKINNSGTTHLIFMKDDNGAYYVYDRFFSLWLRL